MSAARKKTRLIKLVDKRSVSWEQALQDYLLWKKAEGRSERTIKDYSYHIKLFFKRFPEASLSEQDSMKKSIIQYMAEDVKPAYYNNKLVYLKTFFSWCVNENILPENPLKDFKRRKADERIVQLDGQIIKKYWICRTKHHTPDYAIIPCCSFSLIQESGQRRH